MTLTLDASPSSPGGFECGETRLSVSSSLRTSSTESVELEGHPQFRKCVVTGHIGNTCETSGENEFALMKGPWLSEEALVLSNNSGSTFAYFPLVSKPGETCTGLKMIGAEALISGEYECAFHEAQAEAVEHELKCSSVSGHITYWNGYEKAPLSYHQMIGLSGTRKGMKFSVYEGT